MKTRLLVALIAGVGLTLCFDPVGFGWLAPICIAGYIWVCRGPRPWLPGLVFGVSFCFLHISWMWPSVGLAAWLALAGGLAAFHGIFAVLMQVVQRLPLWPVWAAAVWSTLELSRSSWPFSGMPWGRVAFAAADLPVLNAVAWVSVTGLGFLIALVGALLLCVNRRAGAVGLVVVTVTLAVMSVVRWQPSTVGTAQVALVQGNVPGDGTNLGAYPFEVTQNHARATAALSERVAAGREPAPDFVIWPENSTVSDPLHDARTRAEIESALAAIEVPILIGAMIKQGERELLNQGIVWDPATGPGDRYTKRHPVPFGEYIPRVEPLYSWLSGSNFGGLHQIGRDMASGQRNQPLTIAGIRVADGICFDVAYSDVHGPQVANGATLAVVQTSNAMFINTDQIEQQFDITRVRAVELGRTVVVAATNGVSGVIDSEGQVLARASLKTTSVINTEVDLHAGITPAVWMGRWPSIVMFVISLTSMGVALMPRYRRKPHQPTTAGASTRAPAASGVGEERT